MQRQKRIFQSGTMIILLLFLFSISGTMAPLASDYDDRGQIRLEAPPEYVSLPSVVAPQRPVYKIVIDPGHGGKDPGAESASGREEKDYTLSLGLHIYELLQQEAMFEPYLTRDDDTFIELEDRARMANDLHADALLSIHGNTYIQNLSVSGTETYFYMDDSADLARAIHGSLIAAMGFRDRGVREEEWRILANSKVPAVLAEVGFLTHEEEEAAMWSEEGQARTARAIVDALKRYFAKADDRPVLDPRSESHAGVGHEAAVNRDNDAGDEARGSLVDEP